MRFSYNMTILVLWNSYDDVGVANVHLNLESMVITNTKIVFTDTATAPDRMTMAGSAAFTVSGSYRSSHNLSHTRALSKHRSIIPFVP